MDRRTVILGLSGFAVTQSAFTPEAAAMQPQVPTDEQVEFDLAIRALTPFEGHWAGSRETHSPSSTSRQYVYEVRRARIVGSVLVIERATGMAVRTTVVGYDHFARKYYALNPGFRMGPARDLGDKGLVEAALVSPGTLKWSFPDATGGIDTYTVAVEGDAWVETREPRDGDGRGGRTISFRLTRVKEG